MLSGICMTLRPVARFDIQARQPLGVYARCNPDPKTGIFSCCSSSDPQASHGRVCHSTLPLTVIDCHSVIPYRSTR
jgi:hypothetical protein